MDLPTVVLIAVALSLDALAVSVACGIAVERLRILHTLRVAAVFGGFHAAMPAIGWIGGLTLSDIISGIDHWIAFAILVGLGIKMIVESIELESFSLGDPIRASLLLALGLATSIDALAVGVSFAFLGIDIVEPALVIGGVIFVVSYVGMVAGKAFGHMFEGKIGIAGGLILVALGTRILLLHLS